MKTVQEILNLSTAYLKQRKIANARREAEYLLGDILGINRLQLYMEFDRPLTDEEINKCRDWLARRGKHEPLQYIRGEVEFYECRIKVSPDVLIPRQETELLVDLIVKKLEGADLSHKLLWDVCCGAGYIGIALKKRYPQLQVVLSDISLPCLELAKENARLNDVTVECLAGDLLTPVEQADFVVCNPPYISEVEYAGLDDEVRCYEPVGALVAGPTGLEFYQRLATGLKDKLRPGGMAWLEIGTTQGPGVKQIFESSGWPSCAVSQDWAGHDRFFTLSRE